MVIAFTAQCQVTNIFFQELVCLATIITIVGSILYSRKKNVGPINNTNNYFYIPIFPVQLVDDTLGGWVDGVDRGILD